jgi:hypothetical protein
LLFAGIAWSLLYPVILANYVAPWTALFFALASYGLLSLGHWRPRGRAWGAMLALGMILGSAAAGARLLYPWYLFGGPGPATARAEATRMLDAMPGCHLVFVRYGPNHIVHDEWVYNRADPAHAKIVWANDLGEERDRGLIQCLRGRRVWLVEPDADARPAPYSPAGATIDVHGNEAAGGARRSACRHEL